MSLAYAAVVEEERLGVADTLLQPELVVMLVRMLVRILKPLLLLVI